MTKPQNRSDDDTTVRPDETPSRASREKAANTAPDAVMDPSEKTEGKPGQGGSQGGETDPGAG